MREVLIVDDSAIVRKVARLIFESFYMRAYEAADGAAAVEICARRMPGIILLDMNMPQTDSYDVLATLRAMPDGEKAVVIACFVANEPALVARARAAGADAFVLKPFDQAILKAKFADMGLL